MQFYDFSSLVRLDNLFDIIVFIFHKKMSSYCSHGAGKAAGEWNEMYRNWKMKVEQNPKALSAWLSALISTA